MLGKNKVGNQMDYYIVGKNLLIDLIEILSCI